MQILLVQSCILCLTLLNQPHHALQIRRQFRDIGRIVERADMLQTKHAHHLRNQLLVQSQIDIVQLCIVTAQTIEE